MPVIAYDIVEASCEAWAVDVASPVLPRVGDELALYLAFDGLMRDMTRWRVVRVWHGLLVPVSHNPKQRRRYLPDARIFVYVEPVPDENHDECYFDDEPEDGGATVCHRCGREEPEREAPTIAPSLRHADVEDLRQAMRVTRCSTLPTVVNASSTGVCGECGQPSGIGLCVCP